MLVCQLCEKFGHTAWSCFGLRDVLPGKIPFPSALLVSCEENVADSGSSTSAENSQILDSGANNHITSNGDNLLDLIIYSSFEGISMGSGAQIPISNIGKAFIHASQECILSLNGIVHTPRVTIILISE